MKIHKRLERANLKQDPNQDKLKITSFCLSNKLLTLVKAHVYRKNLLKESEFTLLTSSVCNIESRIPPIAV